MIAFDAEEAWCILEFVRRGRGTPEYGEEWDKDFVLKLAACMLEPKLVELSTAELWQISRQVSAELLQGERFIGRDILRKVYTALLTEGDPDELPIPAAFSGALYADEDDTDTDAGAYTKVEPRADVPRPDPADTR